MTSGGARAHSGPAKDPNSLRSGALSWLTLPAAGFDGDIPDFPLPTPLDRELELWGLLWRTPQAYAWAASQMTLQVAVYTRRFVESEKSDSPTNLATLVRQLSDDLGLTFAGMSRNLWRMGAVVEAVPAPVAVGEPVVDMTSARNRLRK